MPKRRAGVNNIIYELDDRDSGSDSGGERAPLPVSRTRSKLIRRAAVRAAAERLASIKKAHAVEADCVEVIDLDSSGVIDLDISDKESIGGKIKKKPFAASQLHKPDSGPRSVEEIVESELPSSLPDPNLSINIIDSVESDENETPVAGCENKTPLVTVKFRDQNIAKQLKSELKEFLITLLNSVSKDPKTADAETDLELHIWPQDVDKQVETDMELDSQMEAEDSQDDANLFFVDTNPESSNNHSFDIPQYCQSRAKLNDGAEQTSPQRAARVQCCFNCDGNHLLHQCPLPKNYSRINQARKAMTSLKMGRYHVEDEQKYGHLVAGRLSGRLRHALGLQRDELPLHIYRMRALGYPPGWLQEARIQHSGITMFDSQGQAIQDPEEEEGELCAPGSKDKFDIKKILDYPGFNVPPSSRYNDDAHRYRLPPMSERDSKMLMLASLAPNAMQAYKRKKLTLFPSAGLGDSSLQAGAADMEIASDEESAVEFPSVPPLPDEAPPPAPPPPTEQPPPPPQQLPTSEDESSQPEDDNQDKPQISSCRRSPSLTDLEEHKRMLLEALQRSPPPDSPVSTTPQPSQSTPRQDTPTDNTNATSSTPTDNLRTPKMSGIIKHSDFGTPVVNIASPYVKLPTDDKFAKDICDLINFENLPDSTGVYKKMSSLLRRVKDQVNKIQDS